LEKREGRELIAAGEGAQVEFKSSARWDLRENKKNPALEHVILKTVAAFLNSEGGTLLLGVSDEGVLLGLEHDYQTLQRRNADGYELFLHDLLLGHYGKDCTPFLRISITELEGRHVCRISTLPSARPIWLKEGGDEPMYIRTGNSTRRLSTREALEYSKSRWKA
jgi:predicted HTH transcriptional regulator